MAPSKALKNPLPFILYFATKASLGAERVGRRVVFCSLPPWGELDWSSILSLKSYSPAS